MHLRLMVRMLAVAKSQPLVVKRPGSIFVAEAQVDSGHIVQING